MNITSFFHTRGKEPSLPSLASQLLHLQNECEFGGAGLVFLSSAYSQISVSEVTEEHTIYHYLFSKQLPVALAVIHHNKVSVVLV